jgi:hypothetical protein
VSEVIWGGPSRFTDPARFAFAHGGKDGHPFPVPLAVYDESISVLRSAVDKAHIGRSDKLAGLHALGRMAKLIEQRCDPFADVDKVIRFEREHSHEYGGMTVFGPAKKERPHVKVKQLSLFDGQE